MRLSIIIPAYNEEKRLEGTVKNVDDFLSKQSYDSEIIVIDDGSTDKTLDMINSLTKDIQCLRVISNSVNRGKGYSVKRGMLEAKGDLRLFMDSDGSTPIDQISKLLPYFSTINCDYICSNHSSCLNSQDKILRPNDRGRNSYDIVIGSRRVHGAEIKNEQPWYRLVLGRIFRGLVDVILPLGVIDSQNGFKMFTAKAAEEIFPLQTINRWAFDVELLFLANKHGFKVKEVPIIWTNDSQSKVTFKGMVEMLGEIAKIRVRRCG